MNFHKTLLITTFFAASFFTISEIYGKQAKAEEKILSDFDSQDPLAGWRIRPGSTVKFRLTDCKNINTGKVLKVDFIRPAKRKEEVIFFYPSKEQQDWRKYETLEFDLFSPNATRYKLMICSKGKSAFLLGLPVKLKRLHCVVALDKQTYKNCDLSQMTSLYFLQYAANQSMTVYVDNLRLVDYTPVKIEGIKNILEKFLTISGSQKASVKRLLEQIEQVQKDYSIKSDYEKWKHNIDQISKIRLTACDLLKKSISDGADISEKAGFVYDLTYKLQRVDTVLRYDPGKYDEEQKLQKEKFVADALNSSLKLKAVRKKIDEIFANEDFAVGIANTPVVFSDYPQSFDGNFSKSIQLYAARREYEPFQIVLLPTGKKMENVKITAGDLTGPDMISKKNIEIAPMGWRLDAKSAFRAEMLRPDVKTFDVKKNYQQPVWVNIFVPVKTKPGDYSGEIKITADNMKAQTVKVMLKVWPFELPFNASLKNATGIWQESGKTGRTQSKMVNSHRFNYSSIYEIRPVSLARREADLKLGTSLFNMMRFKPAVFADRIDYYFKRVDPMYNEMKEKNPELLKKCYVYGFDELPVKTIPVMEKCYGMIKERYNNIKTMCAMHKPVWKYYPNLKNLDVWIITRGLLTPEIVKKLKRKGREVWWYNLFSSESDLFACRIQFWGTYKDKLDGVLFYNLGSGSVGRYQKTLYPTVKRTKDGSFNVYGLIRKDHRGFPVSSIAFECWREGMEDYDYLAILRDMKDKLAEQNKYPELVKKAEKLLHIPDSLTIGIMVGWSKNTKDASLSAGYDSESDLNDLMEYRKQIGDTIAEIYKLLKKQ